jgi:hypothetical protein
MFWNLLIFSKHKAKLMVFYILIIILQFAQNILPIQQWGENTLQGGQNCCHIVFFLGVPCLNFNHLIIMKDFHNVFANYGRSKPK